MVEQDFHQQEEQVGAEEETFDVSPEIQARMTRSGKVYIHKNTFEIIAEKVKRLLRGESDFLG